MCREAGAVGRVWGRRKGLGWRLRSGLVDVVVLHVVVMRACRRWLRWLGRIDVSVGRRDDQ